MNNEQIKSMDPYILLSWANMKLRDEFDTLEALCDEFEIDEVILRGRLESTGYVYNQERNQFTGFEA